MVKQLQEETEKLISHLKNVSLHRNIAQKI